ncbi:hypothetical protein [Tabrizicola sp.]|jgi:hypothetical protein|uniref:hypothetical protein n=1 Tax=Tabrizicola sp. TaxID=2005166 RepID=UPI001A637AA5|nr:hypothetical protein [Tabrizicola sp.]MBL9063862.1 hypothetical protein [Tabrizicola sp.]
MSATEMLGSVLGAWPLAVVPMITFGPFALILWWRLRRRSRRIAAARAAGTVVPIHSPFMAKLPARYAAISRIGTDGAAPMTLDDHILRPSVGVKGMVAGLSVAATAFALWPEVAPAGFHEAMAELPGPTLIPQLVLLAVVANGLLYIFGTEARYNRDKLITTRMMFSRREYRWKDLDWIGDTGAYDLVLQFNSGGKAKVLKHCRGIEDFKMFAQQQIQKNRAAGA